MSRDDVIRELTRVMLDRWEPLRTVFCGLHLNWKHTCGVCAPELDESLWVPADYFAEQADHDLPGDD